MMLKLGPMTLDIDYDRVTFSSVGDAAMVIRRPRGVGIREWEEFWRSRGHTPQNTGHYDSTLESRR